MFVPLPQLTQLSESQRVSFRGFSAQSRVRVNPNAGAQSTSFPNTVVRGVQPTLSAVGTVPSGHSSQLERCLLGFLPFAHASQRLPLSDTFAPLQATLQRTDGE